MPDPSGCLFFFVISVNIFVQASNNGFDLICFYMEGSLCRIVLVSLAMAWRSGVCAKMKSNNQNSRLIQISLYLACIYLSVILCRDFMGFGTQYREKRYPTSINPFYSIDKHGKTVQIPQQIHLATRSSIRSTENAESIDHWIGHHSGWDLTVWNEASMRNLVGIEFPWMWAVYNSLETYEERLDLTKYMILYLVTDGLTA